MARRKTSGRPYRRTERVNELVREIVAEQLQLIDDERLELVTITGVQVDPELRTGVVYFDSAVSEGADDEIVLAGLAEHRVRLQAAIGSQARMRRTPELSFRPDEGVRAGQRIEEILRDLDEPRPAAEGIDDGADDDGDDAAPPGSGNVAG